MSEIGASGRIVGEVSEWSKEAVLKTVEPRGSVGSNPTFSGLRNIVSPLKTICRGLRRLCRPKGRDDVLFPTSYPSGVYIQAVRLMERCESGRIGLPAKELYLLGTEGSNPSLSGFIGHFLAVE